MSQTDHESVFDYALSHPHENLAGILGTQTKMIKITKNSINLDDGLIQISNTSISNEKKSFETVPQFGSRQNLIAKENRNQFENIIEQVEPSQISMIQTKQQQDDQSVELIKQIDCLSIEKATPEEINEIKKKIEILRKQQIQLQSSLLLANKMLQTSKIRNTILSQEIEKYRRNEEAKKVSIPTHSSPTQLKQLKQNGTDQQKRIFPQFSTLDSNVTFNRLKLVYRQCSLSESYCIYQNQGYKIEIAYNRQKHVSAPKILQISIKLTPHHHIASKQQFKFGLQLQNEDKLSKSDLYYEGTIKLLQLTMWTQGKFHIQIFIYEIDEINNNHHTHSMLVPLPISHFFQPRLVLLGEESLKAIKKAASQYTLSITGAVSANSIEKVKQKWWYGTFLSCLGWNELALFEIYSEQENNNIRVEVFGKKNGKFVTGLIQFLSFLLTN